MVEERHLPLVLYAIVILTLAVFFCFCFCFLFFCFFFRKELKVVKISCVYINAIHGY